MTAAALILGMAVIVVLLSGTLTNLRLGPGIRVPHEGLLDDMRPNEVDAVDYPDMTAIDRILQIAIPVIIGGILVGAALSIRDRRIRKTAIIGLIILILVMITFSILYRYYRPERRDETTEEDVVAMNDAAVPLQPNVGIAETLEDASAPQDSPWPAILAVAFGTLLVLVAILPIIAAIRRWLHRKRSPARPAVEITEIASAGARGIARGLNPVGVVQECYAEMTHVMSVAAHIGTTFLTPREFAASLRRFGFSSGAVDELTELYELVRYGGRSDSQFADRAHACLKALERIEEAPA